MQQRVDAVVLASSGMAVEMPWPFDGGCQCGRIRFRCSGRPFVAYTCHCLACQKMTGSAFATCLQVPAEAFQVLAGEPIEWERRADSGNRLAISLCGGCGTAFLARNSARPRVRTIYVGALDEPQLVPVSAHIWTRRRLPWVVLPEGHRIFPEAGDWRPDFAADPTRLG